MEHSVEELIELKVDLKGKTKKYGNDVTVGDYSYGNFNVLTWKCDQKTRLIIGKFCSIAYGTTFLLGGEHRPDFVTTYPFNRLVKSFEYIKGQPTTKGDIIVGNDVWIGDKAHIVSGVHIGDGAVIGAESVVTKDVPPYAIVAGNPAKFIRFRFDFDTIDKLLKIKWWDFSEEELINAIPLLQSQNIEEFINRYYVEE